MKFLAALIMRGPVQAALVTGATGLFALLFPLIGLFSSASMALVTLRGGAKAGALVGAMAAAGCALACVFVFGSPWPALVVVTVLWLPVWALGIALRFSRSLAFAIQMAGLAGVMLVLLFYALTANPVEYWVNFLEPLSQAVVKDGLFDAANAQALFAQLARWMTGIFAAGLLLQVLLGLFIGRWWQAALYNPGGFGAEFRTLRLHPAFGAVGVVLVALIGFTRGPGLVADLLIVLSPLWLLQGLAVIHTLQAAYGLHRGWLVGLYVLLVVFMPHAEILVACLGLVDIWADLRARRGRRPPSPG
ncbi:hypothetical protein [uncultured Lamprocystis sp.]|jgi:hypothetical protein|uniref:hypothetical protein n=1 Tax=uncultured Lamprocystis sp. TaxID=543132 RepID=UPI0025E14C24|nr:hypothetical protein [uncultured Lamprocystis sp.]